MTKIEGLKKRLEKVSGVGNVWMPPWLTAIATRQEIAEWRAILLTRRGRDQAERRLEFQKAMREKYGDRMALTIEEQMAEGAEELKRDKNLARREGISDEDTQPGNE